jgi:hypothetical protein
MYRLLYLPFANRDLAEAVDYIVETLAAQQVALDCWLLHRQRRMRSWKLTEARMPLAYSRMHSAKPVG